MTCISYHIAGLTAGFLLDLLVGDPHNMPHPIRLVGSLIGALDRAFMNKRMARERRPRAEIALGVLTAAIVLLATGGVTAALTIGAYCANPWLGVAVEAVLTCYILAAKSLKDECMKVHNALVNGTIEDARYAVSMIVGRDVQALDAQGVTRAAVETAAENASDGVVAPLIYTCLGGPVLGMLYKAVNTMDSMLGYRNERYEYFGKFAAKLDDLANFVPSRVSAVLMIAASALCGKKYSARNALRIFLRDRFNHKSPNSAQTESVCAGALGLRLAGPARYFGKEVRKPYIGDELRAIEPDDIPRACRLMTVAAWLAVLCAVGALGALQYAL